MRLVLPFAVLLSAAALAQGRPTLVDHPLEVKSAVSDAQLTTLQDDFRMQLARSTGVLLPTKTAWKAAVAALKRGDCEVRNECLQQLAVSAGTLYALYAQIEKNASGSEVTATGRVVNQDGQQARPIVRVTVGRTTTFEDAAHEALGQLISKLDLEKLSPVLAKPAEPKADAKVSLGDLPPPPPPPEPSTSGLRVAGIVVGVGALGAAVACAGFGVSALSARGQLPSDGRLTGQSQVRLQQSVDQGATVSLATGVAAGVLGVAAIVMVAAGGHSASVSLSPAPGGAALALTGSF